ncbi:DUF3761 domain-containing protein [Paraburkholderia aspalathi]|uniref:DUF3761 domain-containing protein n=1 Tax=Paraburkholderia aspalathi TaxID=1324617 RepID=UPI00190A2457|nr:DUF3761 domain-containing protein [Paraburkholderia aspalathi]MBK3821805.1 DUF3761 domain-containing protein [Paraburkholderia aspalathi]MBK3833591.1 DUF3761 domain-containing protein [Paraburkholderia aspalathi]MBK3863314.1 DUF3761 domain-containing protein [Paraburkholderia aspalathi]
MKHITGKTMRAVVSMAIAMIAFASSSIYARTPASEAWTQPNEAELTSHGHYINKSGQDVHSPAKTKSGGVPAGASARCADGTYSFSRHHSGTCSRHGGVAEWE